MSGVMAMKTSRNRKGDPMAALALRL